MVESSVAWQEHGVARGPTPCVLCSFWVCYKKPARRSVGLPALGSSCWVRADTQSGGGGGVGTYLSVPLLPYLLLPFPPSWKLVFLFLFFSFPHFISTTHGVQAVHFALLPGSECLLSTNTALWKGDWILVSRSCGLDLWLLVWEESVATSGQSIFHSAFHERVNQWGARRAQSWSLSSVPGLIGCRAYHIRSVWRFSCRCTQQELSCQSEMQALYLATGTWE